MREVYNNGREYALCTLGLSKTAAFSSPSMLRRAGSWLRKKAPTRTGVRDFMIGDPKRFAKEIASGHPLKGQRGQGKTLLQESFNAPDMLSKTLFYGLPAVESAGIAMDSEGDKAQRIGGSLGGAALGLAAYRPLGMVGSMFADAAGRHVGRGIGKTVQNIGNAGASATPEVATPPNLNLGIQGNQHIIAGGRN